jgi:DNA polymerase I-like protein with 3'-5' exonuclease and polymerase domains
MDKLEEEWENIQDTPLEERDKDWRKKNPINYQVAFTYKALNRLIQASSADQTKRAMKDCFDQGHLPMITVHDELCFSVRDEEQIKNIKKIMENCFPEMKIPSRIDVGVGENWGKAK